jgi:hypothetical protein
MVTMRKPKSGEIDEMDVQAYLASSSGEEEGTYLYHSDDMILMHFVAFGATTLAGIFSKNFSKNFF